MRRIAEAQKERQPTFGAKVIGDFVDACAKGRDKDVLRFLRQGIDPNVLHDNTGRRPLTAAVKSGSASMVRLLLRKGANPNLPESWKGMPPNGTPLEIASEKGLIEIAKLLIASGADVHKGGYWPPLKTAVSNGHVEIAKLLLESGAKLDQSSLLLAVRSGNVELVKLLIGRKVDIQHCNADAETALHFAARLESPEIAELLISAGAHLDVQTHQHRESPLHVAASRGNVEIVKTLLNAGANTCLKNHKGKTAAEWAKTYRQKETALFFRQHETTGAIRKNPSKSASPRSFKTPKRVPPSNSKNPGASDFISFVHECGHTEWTVLAVEKPLQAAVNAFGKICKISDRIKNARISAARKGFQGMADWIPVVELADSGWSVFFLAICLPVENGFDETIAFARQLSKTLKTRAVTFLGEDTSFAMQCELFKNGASIESRSWDDQSSEADSFMNELSLYLPACYAEQRGNEVQLKVLQCSVGKIKSAELIKCEK